MIKRILICSLMFSSFVTVFAGDKITGRYVHITIPGMATLSLAEVQVFSGGKNVALSRKTTQSSIGHGGHPSRAVDGNTSGDWSDESVTHTINDQPDPAWEVDLGKNFNIEKISIWNRRDCSDRLNNAHFLVLDSSRKVVWGKKIGKAGKGKAVLDVPSIDGDVKRGKIIAKLKTVKAPTQKRASSSNQAGSDLAKEASLKLAVEDLIATFGNKYPKGPDFLKRLEEIKGDENAFETLKREALLANPLLDFDKLLLVRRREGGRVTTTDKKGKKRTSDEYQRGIPANWQGNSSLRKNPYDNEIAVLSPLDNGELTTVYKPESDVFVGDVDFHFDADKMLFSSIGTNGAWAVFEVDVNGKNLRQVSPDMGKDVDNYDPVYLPDGRIIFDSSSGYAGVPCVGGGDIVANLHIMNADGTGVRRLCFEQDNDWNPVMLNNGRVMYLRWEYTDSAHYFSRVLMTMNPDGTDQKAFYGSNSYWPNALFYARPIPGSSTKFVATVSGHHGGSRSGTAALFDVAMGRHEADGAVQIIPGYGKEVIPYVMDGLQGKYKVRSMMPYPLSAKYFIVSRNDAIYLIDVFDNELLLKQEDGACLFEPIPLRKTPKPPIVPDRVNLADKESTVLISDIYEGPGLNGVPKGAVKNIRVYKYEYSPRNAGGHYAMGMEAGWDVHQILGTVPVEEDGSAMFKIPANTPISLQPLDEEGKALQLMRSWLVGMPGERLSCIGCHESQNTAPPMKRAKAMSQAPREIEPLFGPSRGFSFNREVQPVLDRNCVGCHDGAKGIKHLEEKGIKVADRITGTGPNTGKRFSEVGIPNLKNSGYDLIHPYVRRNGPEGDYHLLTPLEFHADTSELVQMLKKGHHNVKLDEDEWSRLYTWIDLNAPKHGTWGEARARKHHLERRLELREEYANVCTDAETIVNPYTNRLEFVAPKPVKKKKECPVEKPEVKAYKSETKELAVNDAGKIKLVKIPAGKFFMGSNSETPDEQPVSSVKIKKPFWMGATEITLEQYRMFDPVYDNGVYDMHYKDQVKRGYYMDNEKFPVIRVSWKKAVEYCEWLSEQTGKNVSLPTEAQWEWACRAGGNTPFSYGDLDSDFSKHANLADLKTKEMAVSGINPRPISNPNWDMDYELKDPRFNDNVLHLAEAASYKPNAWGLHDMHGNAAEWTSTLYKPYPYKERRGSGKRVVRGGSWHDRPFRSTSTFRLGYPEWQKVYHTGFRIVVSE